MLPCDARSAKCGIDIVIILSSPILKYTTWTQAFQLTSMQSNAVKWKYQKYRDIFHPWWSVIELQKNKCGGHLYPSFPQQHGPYEVVKISEGARHTLASMWFEHMLMMLLSRLIGNSDRRSCCLDSFISVSARVHGTWKKRTLLSIHLPCRMLNSNSRLIRP